MGIFFCCFFAFLSRLFRSVIPSKAKDDAVGIRQLDCNGPSGHVGSDSKGQDDDLRDGSSPKEGAEAADVIPWENRYEKLWVEVEKREVKSNFRNVAGELKEKFGERLRSSCPAKEEMEEEQAESADESSDEEDGEVIVRPMARARSTVLLTIPEQRESGHEDSDRSACEDRMQVCGEERSNHPGPDLSTDEECRTPSPPLPSAPRASSLHRVATAFTNNQSMSDADEFSQHEAKSKTPHQDLLWKHSAANPHVAVKNSTNLEGSEEFTKSQPPSLIRRAASVPGVSREKLEDDTGRFKFDVGMLKAVGQDLEKGKAQPQRQVEDGRLSHSRLAASLSAFIHPATLQNLFNQLFQTSSFLSVRCLFSLSFLSRRRNLACYLFMRRRKV